MTMTTSDLGTLEINAETETATITFVRRFHHPIDAVWAALTDPAQRTEWFGQTQIEPRQGGTIETDPDDPPVPVEMKHMRGTILAWDPPRLLEHEWYQQIVGHGVVRYDLVPDGNETILTFTHRGLSTANAKGFIPGTHAYFDRLAAYLAEEPIPAWGPRYNELLPAYT